ncbi:MAG: amino acid kinase [Euryarchaeota archaeon]|nr:amino acid kinase [Euryarchaeota archaeon]MBU4140257.1 amino acid kinase [Euryarchaeota archaeon]
MIVVKLGGSLIHRAKEIVKEIVEYSDASGEAILIIPGGSIFADTVRKVNASDEASHWMAILAMEQYGYYIADGSDAQLVDDTSGIDEGVYILLPYALLKKKDELPHTWDVTSDTIAAWVASVLGARFIKLTDVDGIFINGELKKELRAEELHGIETCVDGELPRFLIKNKMNCEILNGNCPGRLVNAIKGNFSGTLIRG